MAPPPPDEASALNVGVAGLVPGVESACFRACCKSRVVPLAVPKSAFVSGLQKIHDGPASAVFSGRFRGMAVAVKKPKLPTKESIDRYHVELTLMLDLQHDNILQLLAAHAQPPEYFLIFPFQDNGSAHDLVHSYGWRPNWCALLLLLDQTASALEYVHQRGYVHRDVKPSNILLDGNFDAKVCDFGVAESHESLTNSLQNMVYSEEDAEGKTVAGRLIAKMGTTGGGGNPSGGFQKQHMVGTLPYMPPEVLMRRVSTYAADVYAFAVTACELATRIKPYADRERNVALAHTVLDMSYNESDLQVAIASEGLRPSTPAEVLGLGQGEKTCLLEIDDADRTAANGLSRLINQSWCVDPKQRPSFGSVRESIETIARDGANKTNETNETPSGQIDGWVPVWSAPTRTAVDAGAASIAACAKLFETGDWPAPVLAPGIAPEGWPAVITAAGSEKETQFQTGVFSTCGARGADKMEDRHLLATDVGGLPGVSLACVFDGHRGFECAEFSALNFEAALVSCWHLFPSPELALAHTFQLVDAAFVEKFEATKRETSEKSFENNKHAKQRFPGCTACACLKWGNFLYVANAGDCRAVLCVSPGTTRALSTDHTADSNVHEQKRITTDVAVSALITVNGTKRVGPAGLAVTRALGDSDCRAYGVLATPEVITHAITEHDTCLVLACDGLWDVVSNDEAFSLIRDTVKDPGMCAKRLGSEAVTRNSGDNITVVVVFLKRQNTAETVTWERAFG